MELINANLEELSNNDLVSIDGGGEEYAYFFGRAVRIAVFSVVLGPSLGPVVEYFT